MKTRTPAAAAAPSTGATDIVGNVMRKARFWDQLSGEKLNERQMKVLNRLLDGFDGRLTSSKSAALTKSSQDTAGRDIDDLVRRGVLMKNPGRGRSTSYSLVEPDAPEQVAKD